MTAAQEILIQRVLAERDRQDRKWGVQKHAPETWMIVLGEEIGEVSKAILEWRFGGAGDSAIMTELTQVVAVGLAMMESLTRLDHESSHVQGADAGEIG